MGNEEKVINRSSYKYCIKAEGFKYHILKGQLYKDSTISKLVHPFSEVETIKEQLKKRHLLKDVGEKWIIKRTIHIGLMMAINLHFGTIIKENPFEQNIIIPAEDAEQIKQQLPDKGFIVTDSELQKRLSKDSIALEKLYELFIDYDFFRNHKSDEFGRDEFFVCKCLQHKGVLSSEIRHGNADKCEADIIDEKTGKQYEVIFEFKNTISKKKDSIKFSNPEYLLPEIVDNYYIHPSKSLIGKFIDKEYTDRFEKNLVIFTFGTYSSTKTLLSVLGKKLESKEKNIKNHYKDIYIFTYDFVDSRLLFLQVTDPKYDEIDFCEEELGFISKKEINYDNIVDDTNYLMVCKEIFSGEENIGFFSGNEIKQFVKELRIKNISGYIQDLIL